jgi:hypothetical protein
MPNTVAYVALLIWPFVTLAMFASMRPQRAVIWSLLAGYLLLPVKTSFDFPGVPAIDKTSIANLSTFVWAMIYTKGKSSRLPREWWLKVLIGIYFISPIATAFNNRDALFFGEIILPGLKLYDAFSEASYKAIGIIPFILGYNLVRSSGAQNEFLRAFAISALGYSLLMLIEIRLSPQFHTWVYGFFPHSFGQQVRGGGFRPVVFLGHGLVVAIYASMSVVATSYLARSRVSLFGISSWAWLAYLFGVLALCKSLGALVFAVCGALMIVFARRRVVRIGCVVAALVVLAYPALRGADLVPVQRVSDLVAQFSEERAGSFQTRLDNENQLLSRANQRPWFGWGGYGRNRVFDEESGKDLSVTDGEWVIVVGTDGWVGYLAIFGILCLPVIIRNGADLGNTFSRDAVNLLLVINLLDLLPNSSVGPLTWLMAGAVVPFMGAGKTVRARHPIPQVRAD